VSAARERNRGAHWESSVSGLTNISIHFSPHCPHELTLEHIACNVAHRQAGAD
jgi:hypothetical protein